MYLRRRNIRIPTAAMSRLSSSVALPLFARIREGGPPPGPTAPAKMDPPSLTVISAQQIDVELAAAPNDGGSAITSYDLRYSDDESTWTTVTGISDPEEITGLTAETLYYVQTRAVNAVGAGDWSDSATEIAAPSAEDSDAAAYIAAVEAADGEALEEGVVDAITAFVVGLKSDGLWAAIDQCCIMAGARTLGGALVPLKGDVMQSVTAFTQDHYDRATGLQGDGEATWINAAMTSFGQNDAHMAVYLGKGHNYAEVDGRCFLGNNNSSGGSRLNYANGNRRPVLNGASEKVVAGTNFSAGLYGVSRSSATEFQERFNGATYTHEETSVAPSGNGLRVFARQLGGGGANGFTQARLAWFSHGDAIDLAALGARLDALMEALADFR